MTHDVSPYGVCFFSERIRRPRNGARYYLKHVNRTEPIEQKRRSVRTYYSMFRKCLGFRMTYGRGMFAPTELIKKMSNDINFSKKMSTIVLLRQ